MQKEIFILENYVFLKHEKFNNNCFLSSLKNLKGLDMIHLFSIALRVRLKFLLKDVKIMKINLGF